MGKSKNSARKKKLALPDGFKHADIMELLQRRSSTTTATIQTPQVTANSPLPTQQPTINTGAATTTTPTVIANIQPLTAQPPTLDLNLDFDIFEINVSPAPRSRTFKRLKHSNTHGLFKDITNTHSVTSGTTGIAKKAFSKEDNKVRSNIEEISANKPLKNFVTYCDISSSSQSSYDEGETELGSDELEALSQSSNASADEDKEESQHDNYLAKVVENLARHSIPISTRPHNLQDEFKQLKAQWGYNNYYERTDKEVTDCPLCGHQGVSALFQIKNIHNGNLLDAASTCIKQFQALDVNRDVLLGKTESALVIDEAIKEASNPEHAHVGRYFLWR